MRPVSLPPRAPRHPFEHTEHGVVRSDPYAWMRHVDSPELLDHLAAERNWYEVSTAHLHSLVERLRTEMTARVPQSEVVSDWRLTRCSYYTLLPAGKEYPQVLRDCDTDSEGLASDDGQIRTHATSTVLLDANLLEDGSGYVELGLTLVSPDERWLAYSVDTVGDEVYRLRFRDLESGKELEEEVPRTYYGGAWTADSSSFYYTVHDEAYRPHELWRHRIGTPADQDVLVLSEPDQRFELTVRGTRTGDLVVAWSASRDTTEVWALDAHDPDATPWSVGGRRAGVEYHAEHQRLPDGSDRLLLVTDDGATEYRLATAPVPRTGHQDHAAWSSAVASRPDERLERVDAFAGHVVQTVRTPDGRMLRVTPAADLAADGIEVRPSFPAGTIALAPNTRYDVPSVVVEEQSYVHPRVLVEVELADGSRRELRRQEAPGHDPARYVSRRSTVQAAEGPPVPVTLVHHIDTPLDGSAPALLYGYGAYEYTFEPEWDPALPCLLDRGVVFVHVHVRGGGEQGRQGWLDGRLGAKQHTFDDFVHAADALDGTVDGRRIVSRGLSAGGLLQGAVFSQRPDRWRGVVAEVPFVDVVSTMLDASIPLTVNEWEEWGDPRRREQFDWMLAYSPYDNIPPAGGRPDLLVTGALHDPRVMVWEPAKWVAALRESDPEWSPRCLFRVELGAGAHVGPAGRFAHLGYEAEVAAWVLERLEVAEPVRP